MKVMSYKSSVTTVSPLFGPLQDSLDLLSKLGVWNHPPCNYTLLNKLGVLLDFSTRNNSKGKITTPLIPSLSNSLNKFQSNDHSVVRYQV